MKIHNKERDERYFSEDDFLDIFLNIPEITWSSPRFSLFAEKKKMKIEKVEKPVANLYNK